MGQEHADLTCANLFLQGDLSCSFRTCSLYFIRGQTGWFCELDLEKHVYNQALHFARLHFCQTLQSVCRQPRILY